MHAEVNRHTRMRDAEVAEKRAILSRFFSKAFPEPKYKRARVPTDFTPYDHGLEIFVMEKRSMWSISAPTQ